MVLAEFDVCGALAEYEIVNATTLYEMVASQAVELRQCFNSIPTEVFLIHLSCDILVTKEYLAFLRAIVHFLHPVQL